MEIQAYKFTPPDIFIILQILSEVEMLHVLESESQWILGGGVHSDERHNVLVHETTACQRFSVESLSMYLQSTGRMPQVGAAYRAVW